MIKLIAKIRGVIAPRHARRPEILLVDRRDFSAAFAPNWSWDHGGKSPSPCFPPSMARPFHAVSMTARIVIDTVGCRFVLTAHSRRLRGDVAPSSEKDPLDRNHFGQLVRASVHHRDVVVGALAGGHLFPILQIPIPIVGPDRMDV